MTDRLTCLARELTDNSYIFHIALDEVRHVAKTHTVGDHTHILWGDGRPPTEFEAAGVVALATPAEIDVYRRDRDRFAVAKALTRLGHRIVDEALPVPADGRGIVVSLYLADDADLEPWADYLSTRPRRGTAQPLIQADAEGVEINVYRSGEFGPDLADAAQAESVEHRDSVGAFPVVASSPWTGCGRCGSAIPTGSVLCTDCETYLAAKNLEEMRAEEDKPEREGFAPPSGHAAVLPPDALLHDGRYDDNRGADA